MGLLDSAKKAMGMGEAKKVNTPKRTTKKSAKDIATEKDEPWVSVIDLEVDPENPGSVHLNLTGIHSLLKCSLKQVIVMT